MGSPWSELLANLAVVAMFVSVWIHTHVWLDRWPAAAKAAAFGLLMGAGAIVLMLTPMQLQPGVFADLRATMIAVAGFFGGPVAGIVAGLMAGAFRTFEGGIGAFAGAVGIAAAMLVGVAGNLALKGRRATMIDIMILGAAAAAASLLGLSVLPRDVLQMVLPKVALPSSLLIFVSVVLSGLTLYQERRRLEALQSRRIYKAVVETLPDCLNVKDLDGRFIAANPATAELMHAADAKALIGKTDFDFFPRETAQGFRQDELAVLASGASSTIEQRLHHEDGTDGWLATLKAPFRDRSGAIIGLITHNRDITVRKQLENELAESQARLGDALTHMADGLVMFDPDGRLVLCNARYRAMFPKTADMRVPGADYRDILRASAERGEGTTPPDAVEDWIAGIMAAQKLVSHRQVQLADGRWLDVRTRPTGDGGSLSVFSDITEAKQVEAELMAANEKLNLLAHRDGLTELLTRRAFDEALAREFARASRNAMPLSLLIIDVDWFKRFNDYYGHPAGDECLRVVSRCIEAAARRPADAAARYGGEEFALILPETDARGAFVIAENLRSKVRDLALGHAGSEKGIVTVSIGVGTFDAGGAAMEIADLLNRADEALYGAKAAGRDRVHGWRPHLSDQRATGSRRKT
ncbi:diguanylate cyclase [Mesorhizobium sp. M8A.F.Ca.ET.208.01.1.1]|uniref:diguanylate cyclase n=1 Tax=unclassified Mesorhizobium TaxID=325217 RepID=UPI0010938027|nr:MULTISPECIES: diguanylate cyclase [unclassified Mesorhizobium]TGQ85696.1 diguanylate cyclase [Mesorhizobium sp. M8A.F.Ca.ET.208.01.1.1]TGT47582.1 diguanylate cyclase [Mesorhizobium sp. M8A.F.Ca.ET.167.01.1.1]